jgi:hypothetical protein
MELDEYLIRGKQPVGSSFPGSLTLVSVSNKQLNQMELPLTGPAVFVAHEPLFLTALLSVSQRAIIVSDYEIEINGPIDVHESILYSPKAITIMSSTKLEMQVFSRTAIEVGANVKLNYPSLLMVYTANDSGSIKLAKEAEVNGSLFYLSEPAFLSGKNNSGQIIVDKQGQVNGVVYSSNFINLQGDVNGIVITDQFYLYQSPLVYMNWISGAVVDRHRLTDEFTLPLFFKGRSLDLKPISFH